MSIYRICKKYLYKFKLYLFGYIVLSIFMTCFALISPYITGNFVDELIAANRIESVYRFCVIFSILSIARILLDFISSRIYTKMMLRMGYDFNIYVINHVQSVSLSFLKDKNPMYLNQVINNDTNAILIFCISTLQNVISSIISLVVPIYYVFSINPLIASCLSLCLALYIVLYKFFRKPLYKMGLLLKESQNAFFVKLFEQIQFCRFIKIHAIESEFHTRHATSFNILSNQTLKNQKLSFLYSGLDSLVTIVAQVFLFVFGGYQILNNRFTIGGFTIFSSYFNSMISSARYFFSLGQAYQDARICYDRINNILSVPEEINGEQQIRAIDNIQIKNLAFSYNKQNNLVYSDTFFQKGKVYGVSGANGTGKSTFIDLLIGLYLNEREGSIYINGLNCMDLDMRTIRKNLIGLAEQNATLIEDDLIYNTIFEKRELTKKETEVLYAYAKHINCHEFIESHIKKPNEFGYMNMSMGEKQKLSILRVLYKNPDLLILDEPSSFLDINSCKQLIKYLESIKSKKIIILISHDQSLLNECDELVQLHRERLIAETPA